MNQRISFVKHSIGTDTAVCCALLLSVKLDTSLCSGRLSQA